MSALRRPAMHDGWPSVSLGDVAWIQQGKRIEHEPVGRLPHPVFGANGVIGSHTEGTYSFPVIGLGCRGSVGTVHTVPAGSWLGNNVMAIWPRDKGRLLLEFIGYLLEITDLRAAGVIAGQVQPQITRTSLTPLRISLPPLAEQVGIVGIIGAANEAIEAASGHATALVAARAALLSAFVKKGTALEPVTEGR